MDNFELVIEMMEQFLKDEYDVMDFSVDFPAEIFALEDEQLITLLSDMNEFCANYEPNIEQRAGSPELISEEQLKEKTKQIYEKVKKYQPAI